jgi:hypothetical protein
MGTALCNRVAVVRSAGISVLYATVTGLAEGHRLHDRVGVLRPVGPVALRQSGRFSARGLGKARSQEHVTPAGRAVATSPGPLSPSDGTLHEKKRVIDARISTRA